MVGDGRPSLIRRCDWHTERFPVAGRRSWITTSRVVCFLRFAAVIKRTGSTRSYGRVVTSWVPNQNSGCIRRYSLLPFPNIGKAGWTTRVF